MTIPQERREELRRLAGEATPGPWEAFGTAVGAVTGTGNCGGCSGILSPAHEPSCYWSEIAGAGEPDAEFIAAANPDTIRELLDALDAADADLDYWMTRAYGAEKAKYRAEKRVKAVERMRDTLHLNYTTMSGPAVAAALTRALEGTVSPPAE